MLKAFEFLGKSWKEPMELIEEVQSRWQRESG